MLVHIGPIKSTNMKLKSSVIDLSERDKEKPGSSYKEMLRKRTHRVN